MQYISTRGHEAKINSAAAIVNGLAPDKGLYVPEEIPLVDEAFINCLQPLGYEERAAKILGLYLTDYKAAELLACATASYGENKFDHAQKAPLKELKDRHILELWHGPTSAFKDMALQILPHLLAGALKKTGEKATILILVATSGDTGKAALAGFAQVPQTKIMVFYPAGGVSPIQARQMTTQKGDNVKVTAVQGNFDDAQSGVKIIFADTALRKELASKGVKLSSANSINWGRLVPQIVYYFSAYADLLSAGRITYGDKVNFAVPTGNFGDILAGYYAKLMGLPVNKLICASNANNVLTEFLATGHYDRRRPFYKTISPSMDILLSSNLERLLYHVTGNSKRVAEWMADLSSAGEYRVDKDTLSEIQSVFWGGFADDDATKATIRRVFESEHYLMDTHTAVAWNVADEYVRQMGDSTPLIVLSTANPYKFAASVLTALGEKVAGIGDFDLLDKLCALSGSSIPPGLASLKTATVLHKDTVDREDMAPYVFDFAG